MNIIRSILGIFVLSYEKLFSPSKSMMRTEAEQKKVDEQTKSLTIYQFEACPFCVKVRMHLKKLGLKITLKNVNENETYRAELMSGGGEYQVPCLRIQKEDGLVQWMYESSDINNYLTKRFA